jgi:hypothetical protein
MGNALAYYSEMSETNKKGFWPRRQDYEDTEAVAENPEELATEDQKVDRPKVKVVYQTRGLYYKQITIVIDTASVVSKWRYNLERHLWS